MAKIHVLDEHLTNMIAAGEVVERPMGVIKELMENSIDAHATKIDVTIEEGGIVRLEVSDNGEGMDHEDVIHAFERHSTSKISTGADLFSIHTLGFRGEALPSIASVAKVHCLTNNGAMSSGIHIHFGQLVADQPEPANKGTRLIVSDLFQKTPARLKHLKSVAYETSLILDLVQKYALCYPEIAFSLSTEEKRLFTSNGQGKIQAVAAQIYGNEIARNAKPFSAKNYDFDVQGLLVLPQFNRATRHGIVVFINHRLIRYTRLQNAVKGGYRRHLPTDRFPIAVLDITCDPSLVDVNVHPSKWEIRLSQEHQLVELIIASVEAFLQDNMRANAIYTHETAQPYFKQETIETMVSQPSETTWFKPAAPEPTRPEVEPFIYTPDPLPEVAEPEKQPELEDLQVLAQFHGKYILAQGERGLYIFDQHASMERVRYEYYQARLLNQNHERQPLLISLVFEKKAKLVARLGELNQRLALYDLEVEAISDEDLIVRELPLWMSGIEVKTVLEDLFEAFEAEFTLDEERLRRRLIATMACHSSVRFNHHLSVQEMQQIVDDLKKCRQPYHCPHGRPTFIVLEDQQLIKDFYR